MSAVRASVLRRISAPVIIKIVSRRLRAEEQTGEEEEGSPAQRRLRLAPCSQQ